VRRKIMVKGKEHILDVDAMERFESRVGEDGENLFENGELAES
jgi:hypothetical protein